MFIKGLDGALINLELVTFIKIDIGGITFKFRDGSIYYDKDDYEEMKFKCFIDSIEKMVEVS